MRVQESRTMKSNQTETSPRSASSVPDHKTKHVGIWMPLVISDWRRDTRGLTGVCKAMYLEILTAMWESNGQLSDDEATLQRITGESPADWKKHRQTLANLFVPGDGYWTHNGIRNELKKAIKVSEARRASATTAINARWAKERQAKEAVAKSLMDKITQDGAAY
jgi:uncharacterized protein YdaU (DUF1376 family)